MQRCNVRSTSTVSPYDVPNPYSVPGCTCLTDKSSELFRDKAQSKLSLGRICATGDGRRDRGQVTTKHKAREEKFARIPSICNIAISHQRKSARVFPLSCNCGSIVSTDIVTVALLMFTEHPCQRFRRVKSQRLRNGSDTAGTTRSSIPRCNREKRARRRASGG